MAHQDRAGERPPAVPLPLLRLGAVVLAVALLLRFFDELTRVLLVVYAAAILAVALNSVARHLPGGRKWVSGALAVLIPASVGLLLWLGIPPLLDQLRGLIEQLPTIQERVEEWLGVVSQRTGLPAEAVLHRAVSSVSDALVEDGQLLGRTVSILEALTIPLIILAGGLFALAKPNNRLLVPALRVVPQSSRPRVRRGLKLLGKRLVGWIQGQLLAMLAVGILATVAFSLLDVPYALLLGVVSGLAEFIPLVGPWLGGIPAVIVAAVDDPTKGLWTAAAVVGIQSLENSVVTPLAMAERAKVHPFITLFALLLFGSVFGFLGVLLALPLVLLVWTAVEVFWVEGVLGSQDEEIPPLVRE